MFGVRDVEASILFRIYKPFQTTANANNNTNPYPSASLAMRLKTENRGGQAAGEGRTLAPAVPRQSLHLSVPKNVC